MSEGIVTFPSSQQLPDHNGSYRYQPDTRLVRSETTSAADVVPHAPAQQAFQHHPEVRRKRSTIMITEQRDGSPGQSNSSHSPVGDRPSMEPSSLGSLPTSTDGHSHGKNKPSAAVPSIFHDKGSISDLSTQAGTLALLESHYVTLEDASLQNIDAVLDRATRPSLHNDRPGENFLNAISPERSSTIKYERGLDDAEISTIGDAPLKCLADLPEDSCDKGLPDAMTNKGPMTGTSETPTKIFDPPNWSEPQEVKSNRLTTNDILIAIIGPVGSGKSTFIGQAADIIEDVGHELCAGSYTKEVQPTRCKIGRFSNTVLIDTPGFGDMAADVQVLAKISKWLHDTYKKGIFISAILCFHRITDNRVPWMPTERLIPILHELCGSDTLSQIFLVTTMWDEVDEQDGRERLVELKDNHWNAVVKRGSTHRHSNTPKSAKDILQHILEENAKRCHGLPPQFKSPHSKGDHDLKEIDDILRQVKTIGIPLLARILARLRRRFSSSIVPSSGPSGQLGVISRVGGKPGVGQELVSGNMLHESDDFLWLQNQTPDEPRLPSVYVNTDFAAELGSAFESCVDLQSSGPQLANRDITSSPDHLSHHNSPSNPTTPGIPADDDQGAVNPRSMDTLGDGDVLEDNELGMDEILIALIGPTGSGKSSFMSKVTGDLEGVGHDLRTDSHTREVRTSRCAMIGPFSNVVLVDTPGSTKGSDQEALNILSEWLQRTYKRKAVFSAILYFHRITDTRMDGTPLTNLRGFQKLLCGNRTISRIILTTTMWDDVEEEIGEQRLAELQHTDWRVMVAHGSTIFRYQNTSESARELLKEATVALSAEERRRILLQQEILDLKEKLQDTAVGQSVYSRLNQLVTSGLKELRKVRGETLLRTRWTTR